MAARPVCPDGAACKIGTLAHILTYSHSGFASAAMVEAEPDLEERPAKMIKLSAAAAAADAADDRHFGPSSAVAEEKESSVGKSAAVPPPVVFGWQQPFEPSLHIFYFRPDSHHQQQQQQLQQLQQQQQQQPPPPPRILGLDMDGTLIRTKSGARWPKGRSDWTWWHPKIPKMLRTRAAEGWRIVIMTNQAGANNNPRALADLRGKVEDILGALGIPGIRAAMATGYDHFRKPGPEFWSAACGGPSNLSQSVFVGDAAGRPKGWKVGAAKDHSCCDRQFASNVGVAFQTPEEYFLGESATPNWSWGGPSPRELLAEAAEKPFDEVGLRKGAAPCEMVIMVGPPASGKTTLAKRLFETELGYVRVNRDELKTQPRCLAVAREALTASRSVIIDNTNPTVDARKPYLELAKGFNVPVRCVQLDVSKALAQHLNQYRVRSSRGRQPRVPDVALNMYFKNFQVPGPAEGFLSVVLLPFKPVFASDADRDFFLLWS